MIENELSKIIVNQCYKIHVGLGPGLLETIYEEILADELIEAGLAIKRQNPIPVVWKGRELKFGFRADILVEDKVILEIKSVENIAPVHHKQLLTYLKLTNLKLGLLINFNESLIKNGIHRMVNQLR